MKLRADSYLNNRGSELVSLYPGSPIAKGVGISQGHMRAGKRKLPAVKNKKGSAQAPFFNIMSLVIFIPGQGMLLYPFRDRKMHRLSPHRHCARDQL